MNFFRQGRQVTRRYTNSSVSNGQSLTEKIVELFAVDLKPGHRVRSGDFLSIQPHHVMTHDNTAAVMTKFNGMGCTRVVNPRLPVFIMDHDIQNTSEKNIEKYKSIAKFAENHGVDFYPPGTGIGHQVMIEQGYAFPYTLTVASDSHSNMYGGVGCLGTPIVRTDAAALWATGRTWWRVPPVVKVELHGKMPKSLNGKDLIVALCGYFNKDEVLNCAVEFQGEGVSSLSIDDRLAVANMTTEWGALSGLFPVDEITEKWFKNANLKFKKMGSFPASVPSLQNVQTHPRINDATIRNLSGRLTADKDAKYSKILHIDLSSLKDSFVAGPNSVKVVSPLSQLTKDRIRIQKGYLVSCVNSRVSDIREAASVFRALEKQGKGHKVADNVEFYVAAASAQVEKESRESGDWDVLLRAGAKPLPPGCGPCIGLGQGLLKDGEVGISATNRNFKGRMGSPKSFAYLASPSVVASSVIRGYISGSDDLIPLETSPKYWQEAVQLPKDSKAKISVLSGFPEKMKGEILFCGVNNLNTDGIYPGKYTYREDLSPEQMAKVVMENYDPEFATKMKKGDILVGGRNFGSGSSREQAATALKFAGINVIIAASFSETYRRNAFNNGVICIENKELVNYLTNKFQNKGLTVRTGIDATLDFVGAEIEVNDAHEKRYPFVALGETAQKLIMSGGLEPIVKEEITK